MPLPPSRTPLSTSWVGQWFQDTKSFEFPQVSRVEVIDERGRSYVNYKAVKTTLSLQDGGRTLKIFTTGIEDV